MLTRKLIHDATGNLGCQICTEPGSGKTPERGVYRLEVNENLSVFVCPKCLGALANEILSE